MYDPYNVTTRNFNRGKSPIPEVKILVPEGYRDVLSLDTTTQARLCNKIGAGDYCYQIFRSKIRAMITKIPGPFIYMSYRQIAFLRGQLLTSIPQFKQVLYEVLNQTQGMEAAYEAMIKSYNLSDGVPKTYIFINLAQNLTDDQRSLITNGLRAYFRDDLTILLDK